MRYQLTRYIPSRYLQNELQKEKRIFVSRGDGKEDTTMLQRFSSQDFLVYRFEDEVNASLRKMKGGRV